MNRSTLFGVAVQAIAVIVGGCAQSTPSMFADSPAQVSNDLTPATWGAKSLQLKPRMTEQQIVALLGQPEKSELHTCGQRLGKPWQCKVWSYGTDFAGINVTFFQVGDREWRVNSWDVHGT